MHKINWKFDNTYSKLSETFREFVKPTPVHNPEIVIFNHQLAKELNLDFSKISNIELRRVFCSLRSQDRPISMENFVLMVSTELSHLRLFQIWKKLRKGFMSGVRR